MGSPLHTDWPERSQHDKMTNLLWPSWRKTAMCRNPLGKLYAPWYPEKQGLSGPKWQCLCYRFSELLCRAHFLNRSQRTEHPWFEFPNYSVDGLVRQNNCRTFHELSPYCCLLPDHLDPLQIPASCSRAQVQSGVGFPIPPPRSFKCCRAGLCSRAPKIFS